MAPAHDETPPGGERGPKERGSEAIGACVKSSISTLTELHQEAGLEKETATVVPATATSSGVGEVNENGGGTMFTAKGVVERID